MIWPKCGAILMFTVFSLSAAAQVAHPGNPKEPIELGISVEDLETLPVAGLARHADIEHNIETLNKDALAGNTTAMVLLGIAYNDGWGIKVDHSAAFRWIYEAAKGGSVYGKALSGEALIKGIGTERDVIRGFTLIESVADTRPGDSVMAMNKLFGMGTVSDAAMAETLARRAMSRGSSFGGDILGLILEKRGKTSDAYHIFMRNSALDDDFAIQSLAEMFLNGLGVLKDYGQVRSLLIKCADLHNVNCEESAGNMLLDGVGGQVDEARGFTYLEEAKAAGSVTAFNRIGLAYSKGAGVAKNYDKAFKEFTQAANSNVIPGEVNLGLAYLNGWGTKKDGGKALYWFKKAADQGGVSNKDSVVAMDQIGVMYNNGKIVHRDYAAAQLWLQKAAAAGSEAAQHDLSVTQVNIAHEGDAPDFANAMMGIVNAANMLKGNRNAMSSGLPFAPALSPAASATPAVESGQAFGFLGQDEEAIGAAARAYDRQCAGKTVPGFTASNCRQLLQNVQAALVNRNAAAAMAVKPRTAQITSPPAVPAKVPAQASLPVAVPVVHHPSFTHTFAWTPAEDGSMNYNVTVQNTGDVTLTCFVHLKALRQNVGYVVASSSLQSNYDDTVTVRPFVGGSDSYSWAAIVPGSPGYTVQCKTP